MKKPIFSLKTVFLALTMGLLPLEQPLKANIGLSGIASQPEVFWTSGDLKSVREALCSFGVMTAFQIAHYLYLKACLAQRKEAKRLKKAGLPEKEQEALQGTPRLEVAY